MESLIRNNCAFRSGNPASPHYRLDNPLAAAASPERAPAQAGVYADAIELGLELLERPKRGGGPDGAPAESGGGTPNAVASVRA